nr:MAG TPA: hypothetical protein [Caudoviricetes sp.]
MLVRPLVLNMHGKHNFSLDAKQDQNSTFGLFNITMHRYYVPIATRYYFLTTLGGALCPAHTSLLCTSVAAIAFVTNIVTLPATSSNGLSACTIAVSSSS